MIEEYNIGGGRTAYRVIEPDAPGLHVLITDTDGGRIPEDLEVDAMIIGLYNNDSVEPRDDDLVRFTLTGRSGLIEWYKLNVGYSPDEDIGGTTPILELMDNVASLILLGLRGE